MTTKTQLRGICQCCGREQAVVRGKMSKHGYTVEEGWFSGICSGQHFAAMQVERAQADRIIEQVRAECAELRAHAQRLEEGKSTPREAKSGDVNMVRHPKYGYLEGVYVMVPFADAPEVYQREAVKGEVWKLVRRAEMGESFASTLERMADEYHGKELREVVLSEGPAPVVSGERRLMRGVAVAASRVERGSVFYALRAGITAKVSLAAWRKLPLAD